VIREKLDGITFVGPRDMVGPLAEMVGPGAEMVKAAPEPPPLPAGRTPHWRTQSEKWSEGKACGLVVTVYDPRICVMVVYVQRQGVTAFVWSATAWKAFDDCSQAFDEAVEGSAEEAEAKQAIEVIGTAGRFAACDATAGLDAAVKAAVWRACEERCDLFADVGEAAMSAVKLLRRTLTAATRQRIERS
tara:strand:+ start:2701 stop:3267 length:567 start_codon:yes stop_codon:yes gene_type:complete